MLPLPLPSFTVVLSRNRIEHFPGIKPFTQLRHLTTHCDSEAARDAEISVHIAFVQNDAEMETWLLTDKDEALASLLRYYQIVEDLPSFSVRYILIPVKEMIHG